LISASIDNLAAEFFWIDAEELKCLTDTADPVSAQHPFSI
jgi:hypothetical protein